MDFSATTRTSGVLEEGGGAGGVELDQLFEAVLLAFGVDDPAEAPAGHGPGLGEAVRHEDGVSGLGDFQEAEGGVHAVDGAVVHFV